MVRVEDIRRLLDSRSLKDKLDAMKRVVALISLGRDASLFFPDVVKNVVAPSLDVKKLVYLYLVHYAEEKQDLALLSINSFQKDISDPNELIRALALRVLSSVRVKVILQIVILAINKCAQDPSPYVRKAAAHAIAKVIFLDIPSREVLIEPLAILLNDQSLEVLGSAVAVLDEVAPQRLDLIHPHFRHLARSLPRMHHTSQVAVLCHFLRYSRHNLSPHFSKSGEPSDPDLALLFASVKPILSSQHPSAVIAALSLLRHLTPASTPPDATTLRPLMRLILSSDPGTQYVALRTASDIASTYPSVLLPHLSEFFVSAVDGRSVKSAKLALLARLCETAALPSALGSTPSARKALLAELRSYLHRSDDKALAAGASRAMGALASAHPPSTAIVIGLLVTVVASSSNALVVAEAVTVLRRLLQLHPEAQARALPRLVSLLLIPRGDERAITASDARAAIVWLIAEFYDKVPLVAPEALRLLVRSFAHEEADVKLQILHLAAKVVAWRVAGKHDGHDCGVSSETRIRLLDYVTACALVDVDYDVRGKARLLRKLFVPDENGAEACAFADGAALEPICAVLLRGGRSEAGEVAEGENLGSVTPALMTDGAGRRGHVLVLSSFAHVIGGNLAGCRALPPWATEATSSALRDEEGLAPRTGGGILVPCSVSSTSYPMSSALPGPMSFMSSAPPPVGNSGSASNINFGHPASLAMTNNQKFGTVDPERFYDSGSDDESGSDSSGTTESGSDSESTRELALDANRVASNGKAPAHANDDLSDLLGSSSLSGTRNSTTRSLFDSLDGISSNSAVATFGLVPTTSFVLDGAGKGPQTVVESWNGRGFELTAAFTRESTGAETPVLLTLTSDDKSSLKGVSIKSEVLLFKDRSNEKIVDFEIDSRSAEIHACCLFKGRTAPVSIQLLGDGEKMGEGQIRPTAGQVVRPRQMLTQSAFEAKERSLGGMFGCSTDFSIPPLPGTLASGENMLEMATNHSRQRVTDTSYLTEVLSTGTGLASDGSSEKGLCFAGFLPDQGIAQEMDVLMRLKISKGTPGLSFSVWVGCENVLFSNRLGQIFKRSISSAWS